MASHALHPSSHVLLVHRCGMEILNKHVMWLILRFWCSIGGFNAASSHYSLCAPKTPASQSRGLCETADMEKRKWKGRENTFVSMMRERKFRKT